MNRGELLYDLQETVRQLKVALDGDELSRSVKTITRDGGGQRKLSNRLTDDQMQELVAAFEAGTTRLELAERYSIGRTSVAKLIRQWRERRSHNGAA